MMKYPLLVLGLLLSAAYACSSDAGPEAPPPREQAPANEAQRIVDAAIAAHGLERVDGRRIEFDFRGRHYVSERRGGAFTYERIFTDSTGRAIRDVLTNEGIHREVNGQLVELSAKDSAAYANSVNSVLYFALLPYNLNDPAVQKEYLGEGEVRGEPYDKVRITFRQEGGGKDFEDEFVYWFHRDRHTLDYLAYNYQTDGGGARFREAYNVRTVAGIRFADYINYKPVEPSMAVATFDSLLEAGDLEELSRIDTENPVVQPLAD